MRVALIKQKWDVFGPWSSIKWTGDIQRLMQVWPNKATYIELTILLKADWYVLDTTFDSGYTQDVQNRNPEAKRILEKYMTNVVRLEDIPLNDYDLVITFDPILPNIPDRKFKAAYFCQEHWDSVYTRSLEAPMPGYDLFLDHMLKAGIYGPVAPKTVAFPYPRCPDIMRSILPKKVPNRVGVDWRSVLSVIGLDTWSPAADNFLESLKTKFADMGMNLVCRHSMSNRFYGINEPPLWGDTWQYLKHLAECQYYVSVGRNSGAGQGLADAASLGCICLGNSALPYHRLICPTPCLVNTISYASEYLHNDRMGHAKLSNSQVLAHQDSAVNVFFNREPLRILSEIIDAV